MGQPRQQPREREGRDLAGGAHTRKYAAGHPTIETERELLVKMTDHQGDQLEDRDGAQLERLQEKVCMDVRTIPRSARAPQFKDI